MFPKHEGGTSLIPSPPCVADFCHNRPLLTLEELATPARQRLGKKPRLRVGARALGISIPLYFQLEMEENRQKTNKKAKQLRES